MWELQLNVGRMDVDQGQAHHEEVATLLSRCAQADEAAFRRLYEMESARLYGVALRITSQPTLAEQGFRIKRRAYG